MYMYRLVFYSERHTRGTVGATAGVFNFFDMVYMDKPEFSNALLRITAHITIYFTLCRILSKNRQGAYKTYLNLKGALIGEERF